jgi:hypothetical protein
MKKRRAPRQARPKKHDTRDGRGKAGWLRGTPVPLEVRVPLEVQAAGDRNGYHHG